MESKTRVVIIGAGMAGGKLVEELLRVPGSDNLHITIIGEEPGGNYDRIQLAELLKRDEADVENFWINPAEWFAARGVRALLGDPVTAVDTRQRRVLTSRGKAVDYDKLVLATGARPVIPPIEGATGPDVFTLRNLQDAAAIKAWLEGRERVLVIGGGILGLELADALLEIGKSVTLSHQFDTLMELQLSPRAAEVLEERFVQKGLTVVKNKRVSRLTRTGDGLLAGFEDGTSHVTDAVVINCGIFPDTALGEASGVEIHRGLVVDERLATSVQDVFALGECAEHKGRTYGLIAPIYAQARVLARVLTGDDAVYAEAPSPVIRLKSNIDAVSMGEIEARPGDHVVVYDNLRDHIYKKLIVRDNLLVGAHLVGDAQNADAMGGYYASGIPLPTRIEALVFPGLRPKESTGNAVFWPDDVTVCDCNGVSSGVVREAIRRHGGDLSEITSETRAAINCGACRSRIESMVESTYDTIVVGAGLGGLTAAANLARQGERVLVVEKHDKVGGYASSFVREGYTFDVSLHNMGPFEGTTRTILENLSILEAVEYIPFDSFQRLVFPDEEIVVSRGEEGFFAFLKARFPEEQDGIDALESEMRTIRAGFEEIEALTVEEGTTEAVSPLMAVKYPQFTELVFTTLEELMDRYLKAPKLKGLIANMWWYLGLPPSELASILYAVVGLGYVKYAGGIVKGTSQNLSNALRDVVLENRGKVLLETRVNRILVSDGKVDGVITDEGAIYYADVVISNAGAHNTFNTLVDSSLLKKKFVNKVRRQENALSAVQLYLGLDCGLDALGVTDHSFAVFPSYDHEESYRMILAGEYDRTPFSCTAYTNVDDSVAPAGAGILNVFSLDHAKNWQGLSKAAYESRKRRVTEMILDKVEKVVPGIREHIVVRELGTPMTMERYTANPEGTIFGPSQNVYQSGLNRLKPETPIGGLYLVGASVYPGGGYPSVISSGFRAANLISKQRGR
jgi:phytoene desaturase